MNGVPLKLFLITCLVFISTDSIWLGYLAKSLYFESYAPWLRLVDGQLEPLWWAVLMVYLLLSLSVVVFVLPLAQNVLYKAAFFGAILGAVVYGIYDFTCLAIFKDFPMGMGLFDWLWGTVLCAWVSFVTVYLARYLK